jgi:hypothetical protein
MGSSPLFGSLMLDTPSDTKDTMKAEQCQCDLLPVQNPMCFGPIMYVWMAARQAEVENPYPGEAVHEYQERGNGDSQG